jgi:hypothetical protein
MKVLRRFPSLNLGLGIKEATMLYRMALVILGVNGIEITVVDSPVAFRRGGASPCLHVFSIITRFENL